MKTSLAFLLLFTTTLLHSQTPRLVVPIGHTDMVSALAFSPDGKTILTGSYDQTAKLWDLAGSELMTFAGHTSFVTSVAFSPDGKTVLAGSYLGTTKRWNLAGKELKTFSGDGQPVTSVAFSPDGKYVVTQSWNEAAILWDLDGNLLATFPTNMMDHDNPLENAKVAFSPDSTSILTTGGDDNTAKLWDLETRTMKQTFAGHTSKVLSVAFSPDGERILTGSDDHSVILWDTTGARLKTFSGHKSQILSARFSPDGKMILIGINGGSAKLLNLAGDSLKTFAAQPSKVRALAFSPDGKSVLIGRDNGNAEFLDLAVKTLKPFLDTPSDFASMLFSPKGNAILIGRMDGTVELWDLAGNKSATFSGRNNIVFKVAFYPDGKTILTGRVHGKAELWDLTGNAFTTFSGHTGNILPVAFSKDGQVLLRGSVDSTAKRWNLAGTELHADEAGASWERAKVYSPDGKTVLTTNGGPTAKLLDRETDELKKQFVEPTSGILSMAFSPDGRTILTGNTDSIAKIWNLEDGKVLDTLVGHTTWIYSVAFSPDGKTILTGSADNTAKLWDLEGNELMTLTGHYSGVGDAVFSPDGKTILTGSIDNTAKLWDRETGKELATLVMLDTANWVVASPSGLFDASPGAMALMHYAVGLEVIELEQLKERYYEPGLLAKIMGFSTEPLRLVSGFDSIALYPKVDIQLDTQKNQLHIHLRPRNGGTGKVSVFINGKEIIDDANPPRGFEKNRDTSLVIKLEDYRRYFLFDSLNTVSVRAYNEAGWLKSAPQSVAYRPAFAHSKGTDTNTGSTLRRLTPRPALYAIVVGTADYAGTALDLKYSGKDARDMANALQQIGTQLFGVDSLFIQLLTTDTSDQALQPSKTNIKTAFDKVKSRAKAEDILAVYFSGHGVSYGDADQALFYYLTMDIGSENLSDAGIRNARTISSAELTRWINDIPAQKQVLILDACNSGRVVENLSTGKKALNSSQIRALDRMKDRTGMFVLTGSAADKVSYEAGKYGQGLLTYSLLQGMSGLALTPDKRVDVSTLFEFARDQVPQLAKGIGGVQTPMLVGPQGGSFDIGVFNNQVHIQPAASKLVFIRNIFLNEDSYDDSLQLTKTLENYFRELTLHSAQAKFIYVDVPEYENAFSIRGLYKIKADNDTVVLRGRLFKGKESKGDFKLSGSVNKLEKLVEDLLETIGPLLK